MYVCEFFYSYNYTHVFIVLIIQILNVLFWLLQDIGQDLRHHMYPSH